MVIYNNDGGIILKIKHKSGYSETIKNIVSVTITTDYSKEKGEQ